MSVLLPPREFSDNRQSLSASGSQSHSGATFSLTTNAIDPIKQTLLPLILSTVAPIFSAVALILCLTSIFVPNWLSAGVDASTFSVSGAPITWSPFTFCTSATCFNLPVMKGTAAAIFPTLDKCTNGATGIGEDALNTSLRSMQAMTVLGALSALGFTFALLYHMYYLFDARRYLYRLDVIFLEKCFDPSSHTPANMTTAPLGLNTPAERLRQQAAVQLGGSSDAPTESNLFSVSSRQYAFQLICTAVAPHRRLSTESSPVATLGSTRRAMQPPFRWCVYPEDANAAVAAVKKLVTERGGQKIQLLLERGAKLLTCSVPASLAGCVFMSVASGLFNHLASTQLNCGATYCSSLGDLTPCDLSAGYNLITVAAIFSGMAVLLSVVSFALLFRPYQKAIGFLIEFNRQSHDIVSAMLEESSTYKVAQGHQPLARPSAPAVVVPAVVVSTNASKMTVASRLQQQQASLSLPREDNDGPQDQQKSSPITNPIDPSATTTTSVPEVAVANQGSTIIRNSRGQVVGPSPPSQFPEDVWQFKAEQDLYWNASRKLFYDPLSRQYYEPKSKLWFDGKKWYRLGKDGEEITVDISKKTLQTEGSANAAQEPDLRQVLPQPSASGMHFALNSSTTLPPSDGARGPPVAPSLRPTHQR